MTKDKNLLDLPVILHDRDDAATSAIIDAYMEGLRRATAPDRLSGHIAVWRNLWLLKPHDGVPDLTRGESALLDGDFGPLRVMELLSRKSEAKDLDPGDIDVHVMCNLAVPPAFMMATLLASHYQVGHDLAMVRLYLDPYQDLSECCRYGSGDLRPAWVEDVMGR